MGENTKIEWCDHTFNPWTGCTKVSPGCANCYAESWAKRSGIVKWGPGQTRRRTSTSNWNQVRKWNKAEGAKKVDHAEFVEARRPRVFCASLADWLDDEVPIELFADFMQLVRECPNLDFLLLTKRPQNWKLRIAHANGHLAATGDLENQEQCPKMQTAFWLADWMAGKPPANVWIGTTVEDQTRADERLPFLLAIPARVRFLSCEPLLGPIEFSNVTRRSDYLTQLGKPALSGIHWVIAGGESGPGARPMHPVWVLSLRNQCAAVGVPFLFKQWGSWRLRKEGQTERREQVVWLDGKTGERATGGDNGVYMVPCDKHDAGRLLAGVEHNGFPS